MATTSSMSTETMFATRVRPVMDNVRDKLQSRQADEYEAHSFSAPVMLMGGIGPDGGATATSVMEDKIFHVGNWNSKTTEDYVDMVKAELEKQGIEVDVLLEQRMIDYLIEQKIPKSSAEYIMRRAAEQSLFYAPARMRHSSLDQHIIKEAERRYSPSVAEEVTGSLLSWAGTAGTTMGTGGFLGQVLLDATASAVDISAPGQEEKYLAEQREKAMKELEKACNTEVTYPKWMLTVNHFSGFDEATDEQLSKAATWADENIKSFRSNAYYYAQQGMRTFKMGTKTFTVSEGMLRAKEYESFLRAAQNEVERRQQKADPTSQESAMQATYSQEQPLTETMQETSQEDKYNGWNTFLDTIGLEGIGDTFQHLGITLATLPDMLLGIFTGKTKSVGLNGSTMMPLAALIGGTFVRNPLLKIPMMLYGGFNLVNKMGQEALREYRNESREPASVVYKHYEDEELNNRIAHPHVEGNILIMDIDNTPRLVTLNPTLADAYQQGAIPLNTLANRILARSDQMAEGVRMQQGEASRQYESQREREPMRGIR